MTLDEQGWADLDKLISALRTKKQFENLSANDIDVMIINSEKKRHEIRNGKIRNFYGRTLQEKIIKKPMQPPEILYHGTPNKFVDNILNEGLIPKDRQYVHLSEDKETSLIVGKRRDSNPIIFTIDAKNAWADGIRFYKGNENIWLSDALPSKFLHQL